MYSPYILLWWIYLNLTITPTEAGSSQFALQSMESFVRRGVGYRFAGKLSSGSAGTHKLCFFLQVSKLQSTIQTLRHEIDNVTTFVSDSGFPWKLDNQSYRSDLKNEEMQSFVQQFKRRMFSKRLILLSKLYQLEETVNNFNSLVESRNSKRETRQADGYLPIIGDLSNVIFGTARSKDVRILTEHFEEMANKQQKIVNFMNSFTTVVTDIQDQFNEVQNKTLQAVTESLSQLRLQVTRLTVDVSKSITLSVLMIEAAVEKSIDEVTSNLDIFSFKLQNYLHGIMQTLNGKFPLEIISSEKFISYLRSIEMSLPSGIALAISDFKSGNILETVKHTRCQLSSEGGNMLLICQLELCRIQETYLLYKLFPAPTAVTNVSAFGQPLYSVVDNIDSAYIGVTSDTLSYILLSEMEMDNCFHTFDKILCRSHFVERKFLSKNSCVYAIYSNDRDAEKYLCKRSLLTLDSLYIQPLSDHTYFFASNTNSSVVTMKCPRTNSIANNRTFNYYHVNITSSTVVSLSRYCAIYSEYFFISEEFYSESSIEIEVPQPTLDTSYHELNLDSIMQQSQSDIGSLISNFEALGGNPKYQTAVKAVRIPIFDLENESKSATKRISTMPSSAYHVINGLSLFGMLVLAFVGIFLLVKVRQIWRKMFPPSISSPPLQIPLE